MFGNQRVRVADQASSEWGSVDGVAVRFHGLVERLQDEAGRRPGWYRRKVVAAAFLGYAFVALLVFALLCLIAAMIWSVVAVRQLAGLEAKFAILCGIAAYTLIRAMAIQRMQPDGLRIEAAMAPDLIALLEEVRRRVDGPRIDEVYLTDDLNAAMMQLPRLWLFGIRNVLVIGLPLMQASSESEFASIVAHELGHSIGGHGWWAGFVYRVRVRWLQLADSLPTGYVAAALRRFFRWYGPWFNAYSFVLARQQEYEADRVAARATSPAVAAAALVRIELQAARFNGRWTELWREAHHLAAPSVMPFATAQPWFKTPAADDAAMLGRAVERTTGLDDTHPCLSDRLTALGAVATLPAPLMTSAAEALLGPSSDEFAHRFDRDWWEAGRAWWQARHEQAQLDRDERDRLTKLIASGDAPLRAHRRLAELATEIDGAETAIGIYHAALRAYPDAVATRFVLALTLLGKGDEDGMAELAIVAEQPEWEAAACQRMVDHLIDTDRREDAAAILPRLECARAQDALIAAESREIDRHADLLPLVLSEQDRIYLRDTLGSVDGLSSIIAGRRRLSRGEQIVFVFTAYGDAASRAMLDTLIDLLLEFGDSLGVERTSSNEWLAKRIDALPGSNLMIA